MKIYFSSLFLLIIIKLSLIHCYQTDINQNFYTNEKQNNETLFERLLYESYKYFNDNTILFNTPRKNNNTKYTLAKYYNNTYQPFPNEKFNDYDSGNFTCENFISVISFEIDEDDNIYALDEGNDRCTAKLYKLEMKDNSSFFSNFNDTGIFVKKEKIILNDFVIDKINNYSYIIYTNISLEKENNFSYGILVINLESNKTKTKTKQIKIRFDEKYSIPEDLKNKLSNFTKNFEKKSISITLSCDAEVLFICPFESRKIYSISTKDIRGDADISIINEAYKNDSTSSIIASNMGNLFFAGIEQNLIYNITQIDNDLSEVDYRSFDKVKIKEDIDNILFISKISLANGVLYLTYKKIDNNGNITSGFINITIEENKSYEKSYMHRCAGLIYKYDWHTYSVWIIFCLIVIFIAVFVIVENKQDLDNFINNNNKKSN